MSKASYKVIQTTDGKGFGVFVTKAVSPQQCIFQDINKIKYSTTMCNNCYNLEVTANKIVYCPGCDKRTMYCSQNCLQKDKDFHTPCCAALRSVKYVEYLSKLQNQATMEHESLISILELWKNNKKDVIEEICTLVQRIFSPEKTKLFTDSYNLLPQSFHQFLPLDQYLSYARAFENNSFGGQAGRTMLYTNVSRINHCCVPNSYTMEDSVIALRPIIPGEEILIHYKHYTSNPLLTRRAAYEQNWAFTCTCVVCKKGNRRAFYEGLIHGGICQRQSSGCSSHPVAQYSAKIAHIVSEIAYKERDIYSAMEELLPQVVQYAFLIYIIFENPQCDPKGDLILSGPLQKWSQWYTIAKKRYREEIENDMSYPPLFAPTLLPQNADYMKCFRCEKASDYLDEPLLEEKVDVSVGKSDDDDNKCVQDDDKKDDNLQDNKLPTTSQNSPHLRHFFFWPNCYRNSTFIKTMIKDSGVGKIELPSFNLHWYNVLFGPQFYPMIKPAIDRFGGIKVPKGEPYNVDVEGKVIDDVPMSRRYHELFEENLTIYKNTQEKCKENGNNRCQLPSTSTERGTKDRPQTSKLSYFPISRYLQHNGHHDKSMDEALRLVVRPDHPQFFELLKKYGEMQQEINRPPLDCKTDPTIGVCMAQLPLHNMSQTSPTIASLYLAALTAAVHSDHQAYVLLFTMLLLPFSFVHFRAASHKIHVVAQRAFTAMNRLQGMSLFPSHYYDNIITPLAQFWQKFVFNQTIQLSQLASYAVTQMISYGISHNETFYRKLTQQHHQYFLSVYKKPLLQQDKTASDSSTTTTLLVNNKNQTKQPITRKSSSSSSSTPSPSPQITTLLNYNFLFHKFDITKFLEQYPMSERR